MIKHNFAGLHGFYSVCGIEFFQDGDLLTVVLTELPNNPGTSVTNCAEQLATDIVRDLIAQGRVSDPREVRWVEHYQYGPDQSFFTTDSWDEIVFKWDSLRTCYHDVAWRPLNGDRYVAPELGKPVDLYSTSGSSAV